MVEFVGVIIFILTKKSKCIMNTKSIIKFTVTLIAFCIIAGLTGVSTARATDSQHLSSGWLIESARNLILTCDPWAESGCTVETSGTPGDIIIYKSGRVEVEAILERVPNSLRDIGAVTVEVLVDGALYLRFDPTPYLTVSVSVFTTAHSIDRDQVLTEDDVEEKLVDVRNLPSGDLYETIDDIVGLSARMNIQAGRILTDGMLELPTLVFRSETVMVNVPIGGIRITLQGIALDAGALGDEIRVRNPDTNAIITAIVTGYSKAEIKLPD